MRERALELQSGAQGTRRPQGHKGGGPPPQRAQSLAVPWVTGATGIRRWVAAAKPTLARSAGQVAAHALCEAQRQLQGVHKARLA